MHDAFPCLDDQCRSIVERETPRATMIDWRRFEYREKKVISLVRETQSSMELVSFNRSAALYAIGKRTCLWLSHMTRRQRENR